jgi:hypothetical protein
MRERIQGILRRGVLELMIAECTSFFFLLFCFYSYLQYDVMLVKCKFRLMSRNCANISIWYFCTDESGLCVLIWCDLLCIDLLCIDLLCSLWYYTIFMCYNNRDEILLYDGVINHHIVLLPSCSLLLLLLLASPSSCRLLLVENFSHTFHESIGHTYRYQWLTDRRVIETTHCQGKFPTIHW